MNSNSDEDKDIKTLISQNVKIMNAIEKLQDNMEKSENKIIRNQIECKTRQDIQDEKLEILKNDVTLLCHEINKKIDDFIFPLIGSPYASSRTQESYRITKIIMKIIKKELFRDDMKKECSFSITGEDEIRAFMDSAVLGEPNKSIVEGLSEGYYYLKK